MEIKKQSRERHPQKEWIGAPAYWSPYHNLVDSHIVKLANACHDRVVVVNLMDIPPGRLGNVGALI